MAVELVAFTRPNPALSPESLAGISDIATLWQGQGTFQENLIEYAGRVCYRSTHRMGTAPNFIVDRVREGHEDIIEHVVVTFRFLRTREPATWRTVNRHCEVTPAGEDTWLVSGNARVWLDLLRQGIGTEALPSLLAVAPRVYAEFGAETAPAQVPDLPRADVDPSRLQPAPAGDARVTLLAFTQPLVEETQARLHHGSATFLVEGVSRACTHQFVRHRLASFSQESQRYVSLEKGQWRAVVPPAIAANPAAAQRMEEAWAYLQQAYADLRAQGIRKEDARFLLPNAAETRLVVTMNFAAWSHFLWLRAVDRAAQWEIRAVGQRILEMLHAIAPDVFAEHWQVYLETFGGPAGASR